MLRPYSIYFRDFSYRFIYISVSYFFCWLLFFSNINTIFLFEIIPLISIIKTNRLIITQITQIFNTVWFTSLFFSFLFVFPLITYHFKSFFNSSWYIYQERLYLNLISFYVFLFYFVFYLVHFLVLPILIKFFLYWELSSNTSVFKIESEISLFYYIYWSVIIKYKIGLLSVFLCINIYLLTFFLDKINLYKLIQKFKQLICFIFICIIFILIPPDLITQFFVTLICYIGFEILFFMICVTIFIKKINFLL